MTAADQPEAAAIIDLLGVLAYGELSAFDRMSADARMAPNLELRAAMSQLAAVEMGHYRRLTDRIHELGGDPQQAMAPFIEAVETFHARTDPSTWGEALVKAFVGDGLAADFYTEVAQFVDPETRGLVIDALADTASADFAELVKKITQQIAAASPEAPRYVSRTVVPAEVLDKERSIYRAQMENSGKPANVLDKIVEGKLGSFYAQVVLPDQLSVHDSKMTVAAVIGAASKTLGSSITVTRFARLKVGEGAQADL